MFSVSLYLGNSMRLAKVKVYNSPIYIKTWFNYLYLFCGGSHSRLCKLLCKPMEEEILYYLGYFIIQQVVEFFFHSFIQFLVVSYNRRSLHGVLHDWLDPTEFIAWTSICIIQFYGALVGIDCATNHVHCRFLT